MATDTAETNTNPFSGIFWGNDPNINQQLRQRIALAMMSSKGKGYPKNIGEGLTAIGDSLGEIGMARRLEQGDLAEQATAKRLVPDVAAAAAPIRGATYAPPDDEAPAVSAISRAISPDEQPQAAVASAPNRIYSNDEPSPLDPPAGADRTKMLATILGEENTVPGQAGVANVIRNRAIDGGYGGNTPGAVVTARNQFEPWNTEGGRARMAQAMSDPRQVAAADQAIRGAYGEGGRAPEDPTAGKTMFYSPDAQAALGRPPPSWAQGQGQTLGGSSFYKDPRASIAATLLQRPGVPQPNPMQSGDPSQGSPTPAPAEPAGGPPDQQLAFNGRPADAGIRPAPPMPQPIQRAPPPAPPAAAEDGGYIMPMPTKPPPPQIVPMSPAVQQAVQAKQDYPNNHAVAQRADAIIALGEAQRAAQQAQINKQFEIDAALYKETYPKWQEQIATQAKRRQEYAKAAQDMQITGGKAPVELAKSQLELATGTQKQSDQERFGQEPGAFFTRLEKDQAAAKTASSVIDSNRLALSAIKSGVITGWGANQRIDMARLKAWGFNNKVAGDLAAQTQVMQAAFKNAVGQAVNTIQGGGAGNKASDTDVKIATSAAGGDPNLELGAVEALLQKANKAATVTLNDYEDKKDYYLGARPGVRAHPAERDYAVPVTDAIPPAFVQKLLEHKGDEEQRANFDKRFGAGAAELEIARAKRRERRGSQ